MRFKLLLFLLTSVATLSSCGSDHDHDFYGTPNDPYYNPYYNRDLYYYYNGVYYQDPYHKNPYHWDSHHFYKGRVEWKGDRWYIVLRENPYNGMVCYPVNLTNIYPYPHDGDVTVRFNWLAEENRNGYIIPVMEITGINYLN